jgi:GR25 family glycosyltransferase involved in LPS biosynthesis
MHMDNGTLGCDKSHRKAWSYLSGKNTDYSVVLEDDAVPVDGFRAQLEQVLTLTPEPIVSLYLGRSRPQHFQPRIALATQNANRVDASFITASHLLHAVGVAIRTDLLPTILLDNRSPIDEALTGWIRREQLHVAYTWPSIVDHRDEPTLVKHADGVPRNQHRTAWWCHTRDHWTDRAVKL